ncbi:hypothetical protein BH11ACT2_BH11ACT2_11290 [soil metagenome]
MIPIHATSGEIRPDQLGVTLPHEHVFINMTKTSPGNGFVTVWDERKRELEAYAAVGGGTMFDLTNGELSDFAAPPLYDADPAHLHQNPVTGSRSIANVAATRELAELTGVTVVLGTGHYHDAYLDKAWFDRTSTSALADYLIADLVEEIPGTGVRAGIIGEIASDLPYITAREERSFRAAGRASAQTGAMISTHAPTFATGGAQIDLLLESGASADRIVIGHSDTVKDVGYSLELLRRGVFVQYDCMMSCKVGGSLVMPELERRVGYVKAVIDAGYQSQLLLSHDVCERSHQGANGGTGYTFLFEEFAEFAVAAGIDPAVLTEIHVTNPRRALFGE